MDVISGTVESRALSHLEEQNSVLLLCDDKDRFKN